MEDLENRIREVTQKAAAREKLFSFLRVLSQNINLSFVNVLLVYDQKPDAGIVCGKKAWEQLGRTVKGSAVPIQIMFPGIEEGKDVVMHPVSVYDIDSTEGKMPAPGIKIAFADRITELTGITWEMIPEAAFADGLELGRYDGERNVFYLSKGCPGNLQEQTILGLYLDYVMEENSIKDKLVRMAVLYVLYERWHMKNTIVSALFGKLGKMTVEEKGEFLKKVLLLSKRMVDDMEGDSLSFNETAFVNELLYSNDIEAMKQGFEHAGQSIRDEEIRQELLQLVEKLAGAGKGYLEKLLRKKVERTLFSYPPVYLEFQKKVSLKAERKAYDGEID